MPAQRRSIELVRLGLADEPLVDAMFDQLTTYSTAVDGVPKMKDGARHFLTALPPGCDRTQKHDFVVMEDGSTVGLVDVIDGYPKEGTMYIGLLAIVECRQRTGLGREVVRLLETYARDRLSASAILLGVVASNLVIGFWEKMGFRLTGESRPYQGEAMTSTVSLMEKALAEPEEATP